MAASISHTYRPQTAIISNHRKVWVRRQLRIAEVILGIDSKGFRWDFDPDSHYGPFVAHGLDETVHVDVHWHPLRITDRGEEVFSVGDVPHRVPPNWRLYRDGRGLWNLQVNTSAYQVFRQRVAVLAPDFRTGDLYVDLAHRSLAVYPYPLSSPLDRVLFVNLISHGVGVMLHACGIVMGGKGYIFTGPSEAGKTTLARLWAEFSDATVLGDECLILRRKEDRFWMYGTPWVGEAGLCSPVAVPTERIFFIHHGQENLLTPISPERAAERLLAQSVLTPYDAFAVEFVLDFCLGLGARVPAFEYGFVPEESAVRLIQSVASHA